MKRFFIFAAMLLTMTAIAGNLNDDPPVIHPGTDHIILTPRDMMDKDRSIAMCQYHYDPSTCTIELTCLNTGRFTELYLLDHNGNELDCYSLDSDITSYAVLETPEDDGTYQIILISEKYYGEASIIR